MGRPDAITAVQMVLGLSRGGPCFGCTRDASEWERNERAAAAPTTAGASEVPPGNLEELAVQLR